MKYIIRILFKGLEIALGCQYRVCTAASSFRFPETLLGMLPGALGTQLLPRLISFENCLKMCVDNAIITGEQALSMGLVDQVIPILGNKPGVPSSTLDELIERMKSVVQNHLIATKGSMYPSPFRKTSELPVLASVDAALMLCTKYKLEMKTSVAVDNRVVTYHKHGNLARRGAIDALFACVQSYIIRSHGKPSLFQDNGFMNGALIETDVNKYVCCPLLFKNESYDYIIGT